jgi:hypothetical protein
MTPSETSSEKNSLSANQVLDYCALTTDRSSGAPEPGWSQLSLIGILILVFCNLSQL